MSFLESLRRQRAEELVRAREEAERRAAQEQETARQKAEDERNRKLRISALKKSVVPKLGRELADLVHGEIHSIQNPWGTSLDNAESLALNWSLDTHSYEMGRIIFSGIEDGSISIAGAYTIVLDPQEAKNFNAFDGAFKHAYQNPKIWINHPEPPYDSGF